MGKENGILGYSLKNSLVTAAVIQAAGALGYSAGAVAQGVALSIQQQTQSIHGYENVTILDQDTMEEGGGLGLPVWMSITLEIPDYTYQGRNFKGVKMRIPCCIVEVNWTNNIVKTTIYGRPGDVKEWVARGDYMISIKGILCNDDDKYPYDLRNNLRRICNYPKHLAVTHPILNRDGIMNLVIEKPSFPVQQGKTNIQPFELQCSSDETYQLQLSNKQAALKPNA